MIERMEGFFLILCFCNMHLNYTRLLCLCESEVFSPKFKYYHYLFHRSDGVRVKMQLLSVIVTDNP